MKINNFERSHPIAGTLFSSENSDAGNFNDPVSLKNQQSMCYRKKIKKLKNENQKLSELIILLENEIKNMSQNPQQNDLLNEQLIEDEVNLEDSLRIDSNTSKTQQKKLDKKRISTDFQRNQLLREIINPQKVLNPANLSEKEKFIEIGGVRITGFEELIFSHFKKIIDSSPNDNDKEIKRATLVSLMGNVGFINSESISKKNLEEQIKRESLDPAFLTSFVENTFNKDDEVPLDECINVLERKITLLEKNLKEENEKRRAERRKLGLTESTFLPNTPSIVCSEQEYEEVEEGFVLLPARSKEKEV